jgi:hypothetical protein
VTYVQNPLVSWLLSHAYGQGGTVAVPTAEQGLDPALRGEFPAGIEDVLTYLSRRYLSWTPANQDDIDWCFLVGGPGNGKSESLRTLASMLGVTLPGRVAGQPVPRVIPLTWPTAAQTLPSGLEIAFVNDASIPRKDSYGPGAPGSLFQDIVDGFIRFQGSGAPVVLFGNVNRGILVEEAGSLKTTHPAVSSPLGNVARDVIRWLAKPPAADDTEAGPSVVKTVVPINPLSSHYGQFRISFPGLTRGVTVHAIFLDALSLLEPRPGEDGPVVDFSTSPPAVAEYHTLGSLLSTETTRDATTAGRLVKEYALPTRWVDGGCKHPETKVLCSAYPTCPFAQNARWLHADTLRHRFLDTLRGAEVAAGRRFTYRDFLGHLSLAILGKPEEPWLAHMHPCDWSRDQHLAVGKSSKAATVTLASHRLYTNLFALSDSGYAQPLQEASSKDTVYGKVRALLTDIGETPRMQAFERAFREIDPSRDTDAWGGMRGLALDAVESLDVLAPSGQVVKLPGFPAESHSQIETLLDHSLREEIASELGRGSRAASNRVRVLRRWRSILLLRQVGVALGHLCFGSAIQAWLAEQENALRQGQRMSLGDGIHHLLLPAGEGGRIFLAPLRPRTYCLSGELPKNALLVSVATTDLTVVIVPHGDTLVAEVQINMAREHRKPQVLAKLVIDLPVAREAILHANGDPRSFTEIGYTAFARIERARASLISRERMKAMPVLFTDATESLYKLTRNPGGPVPLRVQRV